MSYQLTAKEPLPDGIKRIVREQLDKAIAQLSDRVADAPEAAIHDARKRFKKIRAVVRLVRSELRESVYQREHSCFRAAGQKLAEVRDAQVRINTLEALTEHFSDILEPEAFSSVHQALDAYSEATQHYIVAEENATEAVLSELQVARDRIETWTLKHNDWSALEPNFKQTYKRGLKAFQIAYKKKTPENMHEWRKRVKYLWYDLSLLKPLWPDLMKAWATEASTLADCLGNDHDLAVLRQFILSQPKRLKGNSQLEVLITLIDHRQAELQTAARF
ncbi:MAG: CHAD domain-containing protein [Leptolyngbyaceae cyanobacterium SM1_1_3]|nr:CHAD domain-containing protein [Leptolyngbyaceae cyanobacterium SM1_1_3]NJO11030.1 CHAD domain-containing protein [Leptolyngbyaceae cyanobacterium SL_1_1]